MAMHVKCLCCLSLGTRAPSSTQRSFVVDLFDIAEAIVIGNKHTICDLHPLPMEVDGIESDFVDQPSVLLVVKHGRNHPSWAKHW